jgi:hypothetical protein
MEEVALFATKEGKRPGRAKRLPQSPELPKIGN